MKTSAIFKPLTPAEQGDAAVRDAGRARFIQHIHSSPGGRVVDMPSMPLHHRALEADANNRYVKKFIALLRLTDPEFQKFISERSRGSDIARRDWQRYITERSVTDHYWYDFDLHVKMWLEKRIHDIHMHEQRHRWMVKQRALYAQALAAYIQALGLYNSHVAQDHNKAKAATSIAGAAELSAGKYASVSDEKLGVEMNRQPINELQLGHSMERSHYLSAHSKAISSQNVANAFASKGPEGGPVVQEDKPRFVKKV